VSDLTSSKDKIYSAAIKASILISSTYSFSRKFSVTAYSGSTSSAASVA
jgi:hypothetical protein